MSVTVFIFIINFPEIFFFLSFLFGLSVKKEKVDEGGHENGGQHS